jgi:hypothetical protein
MKWGSEVIGAFKAHKLPNDKLKKTKTGST